MIHISLQTTIHMLKHEFYDNEIIMLLETYYDTINVIYMIRDGLCATFVFEVAIVQQ